MMICNSDLYDLVFILHLIFIALGARSFYKGREAAWYFWVCFSWGLPFYSIFLREIILNLSFCNDE